MMTNKVNWSKIRLPKDCPALTPQQMLMVLEGADEPDRSLVRSSWQSIGFYRPYTGKVSKWHDYNC